MMLYVLAMRVCMDLHNSLTGKGKLLFKSIFTALIWAAVNEV